MEGRPGYSEAGGQGRSSHLGDSGAGSVLARWNVAGRVQPYRRRLPFWTNEARWGPTVFSGCARGEDPCSNSDSAGDRVWVYRTGGNVGATSAGRLVLAAARLPVSWACLVLGPANRDSAGAPGDRVSAA